MEGAITSDQMYKIEDNGHNLIGMKRVYMMENAGHGIADYIVKIFSGNIAGKKIVSICGTGNNGGDALVASRHLSSYDADIAIILLGKKEQIKSEEAMINWNIIAKMDSVKRINDTSSLSQISKSAISGADIIIDAIFGTGIKGKLQELHCSAIDAINSSNAYVLAVDIPSGQDPNTGEVHDYCVKANSTITFHRLKKGLINSRFTGDVVVEKIGIPPEAEKGVL